MSESSAKLMVGLCEQAVFIKIRGRGDFNLSLDLKKLFDELLLRGYRRFLLELCDCNMMDSTFLGRISDIAVKFNRDGVPPGASLELINPKPCIEEVLENLGVIDLFKIVRSGEPPAVDYQPLAETADKSKTEVTRNCLEAHRTLMALDPKNVQKFKDVAEFLADDLKRLELAEKK